MKASTSKVNCYNRCKRKYSYRYVEKIVKVVQDVRLSKGRLIHACLENHLLKKEWVKPLDEYSKTIRTMPEDVIESQNEMIKECFRIMRSYFNNYRGDNFEVLAVEKPFEVKTPQGNVFEGIIDLIFRDSMGIWVCDHKTCKTIPDEKSRNLDMQTSLYVYASNLLGYNAQGVTFNYIRTKAPTQPKVLKNGTMSKAKLDTDYNTYMEQLKLAGLDPNDYTEVLDNLKGNSFYKRVRLPKPDSVINSLLSDFDNTCSLIELSSTGLYPRTMNMNCGWDCEYSELCFADIQGVNTEYIRATEFKPKEERDNDGEIEL